jgi:hypothetical protein
VSAQTAPPLPGAMYQANAGWIAYTQVSNGVRQVASQSPSGMVTPLSVYDTDSRIDAVGPTGEVMFLNEGDADAGIAPGRYLRLPPAAPEFLSSPLGTAVPGCDGWYVKMGGTLFRVSGTEDAGTGCAAFDAGTGSDAASDAGAADASRADAEQAPDGESVGDGAVGGVDATVSIDAARESDAADSGGAPSGGGCMLGAPRSGFIDSWMALSWLLVAFASRIAKESGARKTRTRGPDREPRMVLKVDRGSS